MSNNVLCLFYSCLLDAYVGCFLYLLTYMMIAMFFDLRRLRNLLGHSGHVEQQWHMLESHGNRIILTVTLISL
jgi:hypothetical protein